MKLDAELAVLRPKPLPPRVDRPGAIRVRGTHPAIEGPNSALVLRVEDAKKHAVWTCAKPTVLAGKLVAPCLFAEGVFEKPGRYRMIVEGPPVGRLEQAVVVKGNERRFDVRLEVAEKRLVVTPVVDAPAAIRLEFKDTPQMSSIALRLVNASAETLRPAGDSWAASTRLEFDTARAWIPAEDVPETAPEAASPLAPDTNVDFGFGPRMLNRTAPLVRVVVALADGVTGHVREVASDAATLLPGRMETPKDEPCITTPYPTTSQMLPWLQDVAWSATGALVADRQGIARLDGAKLVRVYTTDAGVVQLVSGAGGRLVVGRGFTELVVSRDGGAHFEPLLSGVSEPRSVALAGDDVLVLGRDGAAVRISADGTKTTLDLPKKATWRAASFDGPHGALLGACRTLLVTADGGRTWETREAQASDVLVHGNALFLAGRDGLRRSSDGGATFEVLTTRACSRVRGNGELVTAACDVDGRTHSPLVAVTGKDLVPVPSEMPLSAFVVVSDPAGRVFAVGRSDVLLTGDLSGVQQVMDSVEAKQAMLAVLRTSTPWLSRPARFVKPRPAAPKP